MNIEKIKTLGELKKSGYKSVSVKDEIRNKLGLDKHTYINFVPLGKYAKSTSYKKSGANKICLIYAEGDTSIALILLLTANVIKPYTPATADPSPLPLQVFISLERFWRAWRSAALKPPKLPCTWASELFNRYAFSG